MNLPATFRSCVPNIGIGSHGRCRIPSKNAFEERAEEYPPILSRQRSPELADQNIDDIAAEHAKGGDEV